jgi:hypothetical protein
MLTRQALSSDGQTPYGQRIALTIVRKELAGR